jgi:cytochrome b
VGHRAAADFASRWYGNQPTTEAGVALRDFNRTILLPMRVWDAPTRLFHWALVALVAVSYLSAEFGSMRVHLACGFAVLALLAFRVAWGFVGSETARFGQFLVRPSRVLLHLARFREPGADTEVGHNPAGGWMVVAMLVLLAVQVGAGLCASARRSDPTHTAGPLAKYVGEHAAAVAHAVHNANFNLLVAAIGLHILAILAYALVRRHDLVRPMVTGTKRLPATTRQPRMASPLKAAGVAAVAGAAAWLAAMLL